MEIPRRYGVDQTVGDTLGPGGVFRGLRSMKALEEITRDMHELCPDALLLNYANPMAVNCWFASGQGIRTTGLCHSVQHTADELASIMGLEDGTWSFRAAGINSPPSGRTCWISPSGGCRAHAPAGSPR